MNTLTEIFGKPICSYSRAQAFEDGALIDAGKLAQEAGIRWPVALTAAAWEDCVTWTAQDRSRHGVPNDETGRLWDVLFMARMGMRMSSGGTQMFFRLRRVPRTGTGKLPRLVTLKLVSGPGDDGDPVITIMLPEED